jgi:hypothetical protein
MSRWIGILLVGFLLLPGVPAQAADWGAPPGWSVIDTGHSYQALIGRLDGAVKANKMGLVSRASATLGAKAMLEKTIPGNMVVGLSYKTPSAVFAPYADGGAALRELAAELDTLFAKIAKEAAAP